MTGEVSFLEIQLLWTSSKGETWGLYWSDYEDELRLLMEESTDKYIIKHQEDKHPPVRQHNPTILQCPVDAPKPVPSKSPPATVKLPDVQPPLKYSTLPDTKFSLPDLIPNIAYCHISPTRYICIQQIWEHHKIRVYQSSERMISGKMKISEVQSIECPPEKPTPKVKRQLLTLIWDICISS